VSEQARVDLMDAIRHKITHHPRSLQKRIGPSEIGNPCDRRIGYKLLGQPENPRGDAWKPTIGTAVHAWLEEALDDDDALAVVVGELRRRGDHVQAHWSPSLLGMRTGSLYPGFTHR
jgi:hypothetical protein